MKKVPCVYILASKRKGTIYTGVTSDLRRRTYEHKQGLYDGFTRKYDCKILVWYEAHDNMESAIRREKALKHWVRKWKVELIEKENPGWKDLYETLAW